MLGRVPPAGAGASVASRPHTSPLLGLRPWDLDQGVLRRSLMLRSLGLDENFLPWLPWFPGSGWTTRWLALFCSLQTPSVGLSGSPNCASQFS